MDTEYLLKISGYLLSGLATTLLVWVITFLAAMPSSIGLAILKRKQLIIVNFLINTYTLLIRGTPLLFQLFFVYYGLPLLFDIKLQPLMAASLTFVLSWTAYLTEIIYAAINAIPATQYEAGQALGLSYWQIIRYIILPQALLQALPAIANQAIEILYATPLLGVIGMNDILKNAKVFLARDLRLDAFVLAAIIYLVLNTIIISTFRKLEIKYSKYLGTYKP